MMGCILEQVSMTVDSPGALAASLAHSDFETPSNQINQMFAKALGPIQNEIISGPVGSVPPVLTAGLAIGSYRFHAFIIENS